MPSGPSEEAVALSLSAGAVAKLRRMFEKAVRAGHGRASPVIWRLYMAFEAERGAWARAKKVGGG
jgi:cytochrome c556